MKLCYSCFQHVTEQQVTCHHCGVDLTPQDYEGAITDPANRFEEPVTDYEEEFAKLERSSLDSELEQRLKVRSIYSDLKVIAVMASFLGLLQIYTSRLLDAINAIGPVFGVHRVIDGQFLVISGFVYIFSTVLFYLSFNWTRRLFLIFNILQVSLLMIIYGRLQIITHNLSSDDPYDLPVAVQNFLANVHILSYAIFGFALFYVIQTVYMYKFELLGFFFGKGRKST